MSQIPPFPADHLAESLDAIIGGAAGDFAHSAWQIHGTILALHCDHAPAAALAAGLLKAFPPAPGPGPAPARLCLTTRQVWAVPTHAKILPPSSNEVIDVQAAYGLASTFARAGSVNYLELAPLGGAAYDLAAGQALAYLRQPESYRPWVVTHLFWLTLILELLRGRGLYWVHAAAVAQAGRSVLIVGQTGAGKTTTCLALVGGGFQFLSEDRVFVRAEAEAVELLAFPKDISVTDHTVELLPWLSAALGAAPAARRKREISPARLFPQALAERARPGAILFPRLSGAARSEARPVGAATALQRLLPNSLLASQPAVSARHFDALARLAEASRCYDLLLGPDLDRLPDLARGLLA